MQPRRKGKATVTLAVTNGNKVTTYMDLKQLYFQALTISLHSRTQETKMIVSSAHLSWAQLQFIISTEFY